MIRTTALFRRFQCLPHVTDFEAASLAIIGFNADGTDGYSLATFEDIATGTVINFTDDEWNGSAFADENEADWAWTATADVPGGTVINFIDMANIASGAPAASASVGMVGPVGTSINPGFSASGEVLYAFTGTRDMPTFLAAISSADASDFDFGGLTGGHAVQLAVNSDGAKYTGPRDGQQQFSGYLSPIADVANNWIDANGSGDNNFDPTPFTVPEPATWSLVSLSLLAIGIRRD